MYFISRGSVEVYITPDGYEKDKKEDIKDKVLHKFSLMLESKFPPRLVRVIDEGNYFGEIALLSFLRRTTTVKA